MFKLTKHSFLNSIRIWSGSELWRFFFFFFKGERIWISLKAGHHRPTSETPLNGVSLACRWWPNVECWLGSFENFRGSGPVLIRNSIFLWFFAPSGSANGQCIHLLRYTEYPFYRAHRLLYATAYFLSHAQILNWRNILSWIPFGSDLDPNHICKCKLRERERLVHAHPFASTYRQVEREEREMCTSFFIYVFQSFV